MADALIPLYSTTLASAVSSVTIAGIPNGYRDLRLVLTYINTATAQTILQINGDLGSNYSRVIAAGQAASGATSASATGTSIVCMNWSAPSAGTVVPMTADFFDYAQTDKHKSVLLRSNHFQEVDMVAARWASTAAITSLLLTPDSGSYAAGTTVALFGIVG